MIFWAILPENICKNKNAIKDYLFDKKYIFAAVTKHLQCQTSQQELRKS